MEVLLLFAEVQNEVVLGQVVGAVIHGEVQQERVR